MPFYDTLVTGTLTQNIPQYTSTPSSLMVSGTAFPFVQDKFGTPQTKLLNALQLGQMLGPQLLIPTITSYSTTGTYTWTKPANILFVVVEVVGGGGGGGGAPITSTTGTYSAGGGGAGGGYAKKMIAAASLGATETVVVGAGGLGVAGSTGTFGGSSQFGSHCVATGGSPGAPLGAFSTAGIGGATGLGGIGTAGDILASGGAGMNGARNIETVSVGGNGGSSIYGGGGTCVPIATTQQAQGSNAQNYGGGGAGSANGQGKPALAGGNGSKGFVIVYEYRVG